MTEVRIEPQQNLTQAALDRLSAGSIVQFEGDLYMRTEHGFDNANDSNTYLQLSGVNIGMFYRLTQDGVGGPITLVENVTMRVS